MTTIDDILEEENILTPIVCKFCDRFVTYIEFDLVLHLSEAHSIGGGYLDTPPTPYTPSRSWLNDSRIRDAINEGKELGAELDYKTSEKLDLDFGREKTSSPSIRTTSYEDNPEGVTPWSQRANSFTFTPIIPVTEFFKDDYNKPYSELPSHCLEQSPCYPILGVRHMEGVKYDTIYYCELCQPEHANDSKVSSIDLSTIEHHVKYRDPERHKAEILGRLSIVKKEQVISSH